MRDTANAVRHSAQTFTVTTTGTYDQVNTVASPATDTTSATWDNYPVLYSGTFTAAAPLTNAVVANDDNATATTRSGAANVTRAAGTTYYPVTTGTAADQSGSRSSTRGPGTFTVPK